jgi:hypothetical protein
MEINASMGYILTRIVRVIPIITALLVICWPAVATPTGAFTDPERRRDLISESFHRPIVLATKIAKAPIIEGIPEREEWASAARVAPFVSSKNGVPLEVKTTAFIGYSVEALYIAFQIEKPLNAGVGGGRVSPETDGEERFEFIVRPRCEPMREFRFRGKLGAIEETKGTEDAEPHLWRGHIEYAARLTDSGWEGEIRIPFAAFSLPMPQPGDIWQISLTNRSNRIESGHIGCYSSSSANDSEGFGYIIFGGEGIVVKVLQAGVVSRSEVGAVLELSNFTTKDRLANVCMDLYAAKRDSELRLVQSADELSAAGPEDSKTRAFGRYASVKEANYDIVVPALQSRRITFVHQSVSGNHLLHYRVQEAEKVLSAGTLPFVQSAPLNLILTPYVLSAGVVEVTADYLKMPDIKPGDLVVLELLDHDKGILKEISSPVNGTFRRTLIDIPTKQLPIGRYTLRCLLRGADGTLKAERQVPLNIDLPPKWWDNSYGYPHLADNVPEPWIPMERTDDGFELWNRRIILGERLQPKQIRNGSLEMLSRPMNLEINAGRMVFSNACLSESHKTAISYRQEFSGENLSGELLLTAEFDGFMKYSLRLIPKGTRKLDRLVLEIPLRPELTTHYNHGSLGTPPSSQEIKIRKGYGPLNEIGLSLPFTHGIWIGTESLGLQWVAEKDQWWLPEDPQKAVVVERKANETVLRINFVERPFMLREPAIYEWAFIPTPTKPMNQEFLHGLRLAQSGLRLDPSLTRLESQTEAYIDAMVDGGANAFCQWAWNNQESLWNQDFGAPGYRSNSLNVVRMNALNHAIRVAHGKGIKWFIVYGIWSCFPNWDNVGSLWNEQALHPLVSSFDGYLYCPRKPFADWYIATLQETIRELDIDGVYLDSSVDPLPCANLHHGCGYLDQNGRIHATYPVFATREFHKRIYYLFHGEIKRGGLVYAHNSHYPFAAVESFVDVHHCGEGSTLDAEWIIPKFYGYPFGIPVSFTRWNSPTGSETRMNAWRFVLQVDSTIKAHPSFIISENILPGYIGLKREWYANKDYDNNGEAVWQIWNAYKKFPWERSRWIPNWKIKEFVEVNTSDNWVCMHLNPGIAALLTVSSFTQHDSSCRLSFNWKEMGFVPGRVSVTDCMTGEVIPTDSEGVDLSVKSNLWRMFEVRPR